MTYNRALEVLGILLEPPHRLPLGRGALHNARDALRADILQDAAQLVGSRRLLGDVELELVAAGGLALRLVVAGLVLGRRLRRGSRRLPQSGSHSHRRGRARLVEEGDDVEGFVLLRAQ